MAVRLVVTFQAASGKGAELAQAMKARCEVSRQDAGCEQFEVFQSVSDPDKLVLLELWEDQAALDAAKLLSLTEGIIPALESAHAIAGLIERLPQFKSSDLVILNLSGRGDKDMDTYKRLL